MRREDKPPTNWRKNILWTIGFLAGFTLALAAGWWMRHRASDSNRIPTAAKPMKIAAPVKKPAANPAIPAKTKEELDLDKLWAATIKVESNGKADALGDGGKAIGIAQIHKICVDDINRIVSTPLYTYEDRLDPIKSREMWEIYLYHYGWEVMDSPEKLSRIWNGGPTGYKKKSTLAYWEKVKKAGSFE
jgi:hypothetical protein